MCLLGWNLHLIYSSVMYNLEGLWPYVWAQLCKKASAYGGPCDYLTCRHEKEFQFSSHV